MECMYCKGKMNLTKDIFHVDRKGIHLTIDQLNVYKCEQCGELLIPTTEVNLIQNTIKELEKALDSKVA